MRPLSFFTALVLFIVSWGDVLAQGQVTQKKDLNRSASRLVKNFEARYGGKVGVSTQILKTGKVPFSYNGTEAMIPASNLKLVTTAVGLDVLGPSYRFETKLYGSSKIQDGVLDGDIVLKGSGDPSFFPPFVDSATTPFKNLVAALGRQGIRKITGDVIIDDSDFDREFIPKSYHSRYLLDRYAAPVGGLSLNRNVVTLNVGPKGIIPSPRTGSLKLKKDVKIGNSNQIWAERPRGTDKITVHGYVRSGKTAQTTLTINDPVRFAGSVFYRIVNKSGINVVGKWKTVREGVSAKLSGKILLAKHRSPKLVELVERTNVDSDNIVAQHIFKRLGASAVGYGTAANSEAVVKDFLKRHRISAAGLKMVDGSGLSEKNKIAPYQVVHLLKAMWDHHQGQLYIDSLPAPGEGTLKRRMRGLTVRAKTGTLNNHSALSGYVVTAYGETIGFSILVNDVSSTWPAVELQDKLVSLLGNWNQKL